MTPRSEHPHGLSDRDFDSLFTSTSRSSSTSTATLADPPARLPAHQPPQPARARYKEKANINTPLELAIDNENRRFSLASTSSTACRGCRWPARMQGEFRTCRSTAAATRTSTGSTRRKRPTGPGRSDARGGTREDEAHERQGGTGRGDARRDRAHPDGTSVDALKLAIMDNRFALLGRRSTPRRRTTTTRRSPTRYATASWSASWLDAPDKIRVPAPCATSRPNTCSARTPATTS